MGGESAAALPDTSTRQTPGNAPKHDRNINLEYQSQNQTLPY